MPIKPIFLFSMLNLYPIIFRCSNYLFIFFKLILFDFSIIENIRYFQILSFILSFLIFIGLSFISAAFSLTFYRGAWIYNIHNTLTILFGGVLYTSFINEALLFKYILPLSSIIESLDIALGQSLLIIMRQTKT